MDCVGKINEKGFKVCSNGGICAGRNCLRYLNGTGKLTASQNEANNQIIASGKADSVELKDNEMDESECILIEIGRREMWEKICKNGHCEYAVWNGNVYECWGFDNAELDGYEGSYENCPIAKEGK